MAGREALHSSAWDRTKEANNDDDGQSLVCGWCAVSSLP